MLLYSHRLSEHYGDVAATNLEICMKTLSKIALVGAVASVMTVSASAAMSYGAPNAGEPYVGVKIGQTNPDVLGINEKATGYGVYGGYNFDQNFGAEAEFLGTDTKSYNVGNSKYEYDAKTYGAYGTYRYHFNNTPFYAKGKLGIAKTEIDDKGVNVNYSGTVDKTSLAGGVAVGFKPASNIGIEAGYNYLNQDTTSLTLGAHLSF